MGIYLLIDNPLLAGMMQAKIASLCLGGQVENALKGLRAKGVQGTGDP
jgi:hypothetical protein